MVQIARTWTTSLVLIALVLLLNAQVKTWAGTAASAETLASIGETIKRIQVEHSVLVRDELGDRLFRLVERVDSADFPPALIDALADLLRHSDEWVRIVAASSLGHVGPRASRAIPALESALRNEVIPLGTLPEMSAAGSISSALRDIRGKPIVQE